MHSTLKVFTSAVLTMAIMLSSFSFAAAIDEGMFTPDQIAGLPLRQKGLKINPLDIYNPNGKPDISDAVISLSIGCSAEFVSPQGLILTNHHCGFDALVAASSAGKNYGEDGYKANSMKDELPAKDYSLTMTNRVENITAKVNKGTENLSDEAFEKATEANLNKVLDEEKAKVPASDKASIKPLDDGQPQNRGKIGFSYNNVEVEIRSMNNGFFYYLYQTTQLDDIRVVYAPPKMIGFYGGDPDNFEWSRHTGDFTFLRAYVAPDGSAAKYSPNNVPYKPKKFLTASLSGVKENDFVFVMGYPGGTTRYRESQFIDYAQNVNFPFLAELFTAWANGLRAIGETDEAKKVALQSDIANYDNSRKAFEGAVVSLRRSDFVDQRRADEAKFAAWVNANPQRKAKYGTLLSDIDKLSKEYYANSARERLLRTVPLPNFAPVYSQILTAVAAVRAGTKLDDARKANIEAVMKDREPLLETEMLKYFLRAASELPADQKFAAVENVFGKYQGKARRDAEAKWVKSIVDDRDFNSAGDIINLYSMSYADLQKRFPDIVSIAAAQVDVRNLYAGKARKYNTEIENYRLLYQEGMAEMNKGKLLYPDANFTQRFTYGYVKGYKPREAVVYTPFTTLKGVIEKDTGVFPFDMPEKLKDLQRTKDFGRYGVGDSVPVNFLSTTDIIGGNSGSPIMNAYGEQVGIVFDGNFEGLGNDIFFDPNYNRTIAVDIRYVLFVTEKFAGAKWIVDEMTLKGGAVRTKAAGKR